MCVECQCLTWIEGQSDWPQGNPETVGSGFAAIIRIRHHDLSETPEDGARVVERMQIIRWGTERLERHCVISISIYLSIYIDIDIPI
jgi:hypothetical protein